MCKDPPVGARIVPHRRLGQFTLTAVVRNRGRKVPKESLLIYVDAVVLGLVESGPHFGLCVIFFFATVCVESQLKVWEKVRVGIHKVCFVGIFRLVDGAVRQSISILRIV